MKTKHTQGPWEFHKSRNTQDTEIHSVTARANDDGRLIVLAVVPTVSDDGQDGGESNHNARLIAAAPDLLKALEIINALAKDGAITKHETGKPTWGLIDELSKITNAALARAR